jgi:hypothetical protein
MAGEVVEGSNVTLVWEAVEDPSGVTYRVEVGSFDEEAKDYVISQRADGLEDTKLVHVIVSTRERWRVTAIDGVGNESEPSAWAKYALSTIDGVLILPAIVMPWVPQTTTTTGLY